MESTVRVQRWLVVNLSGGKGCEGWKEEGICWHTIDDGKSPTSHPLTNSSVPPTDKRENLPPTIEKG